MDFNINSLLRLTTEKVTKLKVAELKVELASRGLSTVDRRSARRPQGEPRSTARARGSALSSEQAP